MNTTARIERYIRIIHTVAGTSCCQRTLSLTSSSLFSNSSSTGEKNRIHISQETSDLLIQAGKRHWVVTRKDKVVAKGKVRSPP